ncbi:hypothetical protein AF306_09865 [Listeria monocytogenes]|nr:hypothetical protein [Listeria monocytogenes]EAD8601508.1 hypothetical protein [Listeria monocytogenes]
MKFLITISFYYQMMYTNNRQRKMEESYVILNTNKVSQLPLDRDRAETRISALEPQFVFFNKMEAATVTVSV